MDIAKILHIIETAVQVTPDFIRLGEEIAKTASGKDQDQLQAALADARARSDALHAGIQESR